MKKIKGFMIAVPDKKNPDIVRYHRVSGFKFMYGDKIVKEYYDDGTEVVVGENKVKSSKKNTESPKEITKTKKGNIKKSAALNDDLIQEEEEIRLQISSEVKRILREKKEKNSESIEKTLQKKAEQQKKKRTKKKISKPKAESEYFKIRYTAPKERGIVARIINRMKYENGWYDDIEAYLDDDYNYVYDDMEWSKNAEKRRDRRLYKRVQAYEDAEDDITMKKAFLTAKVTAAVALLATLGFSVNLLYNEVHDLIHNNSYVAQAQEKSTLANANVGQIEYAERVLAKIDYNFEHLSHSELLDTVIRVGSKPSKITENRAMATMKNAGEFADQKLLEEIIQEAYEDEYDGFGVEKKQELNQLVYEMLDDNVKIWIRSPEKVAELKEKDALETKDMESEK